MANNNVNPSGYKFNIPPVNSDPFWDNSGGGDVPDITASATVDSEVGTPSVDVVKSGVDPINFAFSFHNLKGEPGTDGADGQDGQDGQDGAKGEKGDKGDKGDKGEPGQDGADGQDGTTPVISIAGTISTTTPASPSVTVTKTGTDEAPSFNFAFGGLNALQGKVFSGEYDPDTGEPIYNDSPIITNNLIQSIDDLGDPSFDGKEGVLVPSIKYVNTEFGGKQNPLYGLDEMERVRTLNAYYNYTRNLIQTVTGYSDVHDGLQIPSMRAVMEVYTEALNKGGGVLQTLANSNTAFGNHVSTAFEDLFTCLSSTPPYDWTYAFVPCERTARKRALQTRPEISNYNVSTEKSGEHLILSSSSGLSSQMYIDIKDIRVVSPIPGGYMLVRRKELIRSVWTYNFYIVGCLELDFDTTNTSAILLSSKHPNANFNRDIDPLSSAPKLFKIEQVGTDFVIYVHNSDLLDANYSVMAILGRQVGSAPVYDELHFYSYDGSNYNPISLKEYIGDTTQVTFDATPLSGTYSNTIEGTVYYVKEGVPFS